MKGSLVKPTGHKALPMDGLVTSSAMSSEATMVDDAYVHWRGATSSSPIYISNGAMGVGLVDSIDQSYTHCASFNRRIMAVVAKHVGMYTSTLGTIKPTEYRIILQLKMKQIRHQLYCVDTTSREVVVSHVQTHLDAGIADAAETECIHVSTQEKWNHADLRCPSSSQCHHVHLHLPPATCGGLH